MKEGYPQREPEQSKIKGLVSHFGCDRDSIEFLRGAEGDKFFVILEAKRLVGEVPWIIKATTNRRNAARLQVESDVLSLLPRDYLKNKKILIPEIEQELTEFDGVQAIMISKMPKGRKASFRDFCHVLEVFRQMEIPNELKIERLEPDDYLRKTLTRLRFLKWIGALKGLRKGKGIEKFYFDNLESLEPFSRVFVHGDFKGKHVREIDEELGVIDFDKSVIGCELEDWAWLSVRHPTLSTKITDYLKEEVFRSDDEKLRNFDTAFRLMQVDRLIEAYFTRTYQWRGNLDAFSYVSKAWGRAILNIMLRT